MLCCIHVAHCRCGVLSRMQALSHAFHGYLQDLRRRNAEHIAEARAQAPEWIDKGGYDVITVPEGSTTSLDGKKMRVFTKSDYRKLLQKEPAL